MSVFVSTGLKTCLREWPRWRSASGFLSLFKMFHHVEELFPLLLKTLSDPSDEVSRRPRFAMIGVEFPFGGIQAMYRITALFVLGCRHCSLLLYVVLN